MSPFDIISRKAMQKQMQTDAKGAIMTLLKQIKRVPVERQNEVAMKLFGQESIAAIAPLLENLGLLKQAFEIANSNVDDSVLEEYQNRMKTTATEEAKLAQQTRNLGITVGNAALPAYNAFLKTMSKGVGVITGFAKEYPNVTTALLGGVGALAALTVGGIVFGYAYNGLATTINAVKGFEYGDGFNAAFFRGSERNDRFFNDNGHINTRTNNSGGIQGGISNGQDIYFRVAFKSVATILMEQETVNMEGEDTILKARGRHDPCVLPRAVPIVESMTAMTLLDYLLIQKTRENF